MNTKNALTSKTVWGAFIGLFAMFFPSVLTHVFGISDPSMIAAHVVTIVGFGLTIYGRIKAKQPLNLFGDPGTTNQQAGIGTAGCLAVLALACATILGLTGCNATATAQAVQKIVDGIVNIIKVDVPALPPADAAIAQPWANLVVVLDGQLDTCVTTATAAGGKKAVFLGCFNAFAAGATSPAELAQLRVMSAGSQNKVEIWATAVILAVNTALTNWGGAQQPIPAIAPTPATNAELRELRVRLGIA